MNQIVAQSIAQDKAILDEADKDSQHSSEVHASIKSESSVESKAKSKKSKWSRVICLSQLTDSKVSVYEIDED